MLRSHRFAALNVLALAIFAMLLAGCSETVYDLRFKGGNPLNVREGQSRTVRVMLYYLKDANAFEEASDEDLWAGGNDDVKKELVGDVVEFDVLPGTDAKWQLYNIGELESDVQYVGIFALFAQKGQNDRRADVIQRSLLNKAYVTFSGNSLNVDWEGKKTDAPKEGGN